MYQESIKISEHDLNPTNTTLLESPRPMTRSVHAFRFGGELLDRLHAVLRTAVRLAGASAPEPMTFTFRHIKMELVRRRVWAYDSEVKLTKLEFDLLKSCVQHAGKVPTHRFLLKEVWGPQSVHEAITSGCLSPICGRNSKTIGARPCYLLTEQGVGYRLLTEWGPNVSESAMVSPVVWRCSVTLTRSCNRSTISQHVCRGICMERVP
jgi:hypothetical protein